MADGGEYRYRIGGAGDVKSAVRRAALVLPYQRRFFPIDTDLTVDDVIVTVTGLSAPTPTQTATPTSPPLVTPTPTVTPPPLPAQGGSGIWTTLLLISLLIVIFRK